MPIDHSIPVAIEHDGLILRTGRQPDSPLLLASLPPFREAYPLVPESQWAESDQFETFNTRVLYQIQNGCVGHSTCSAFENAWVASGQDPTNFSPTWVYALCNGGRDNGASIGDTIAALQKVGMCLETTFPESKYFLGGPAEGPARKEAANYKLDDAYVASNWDEVGTALHMGYQVVDSCMVGNSFMRLAGKVGPYGIPQVNPGPGNHAICGGGIMRSQGTTYQIHLTSWGTQTPFGPTGRFLTTRAHVECQSWFAAVVFRSVRPGPAFQPPRVV